MTEQMEWRGRDAGAAVRARTATIDPAHGLEEVLRRGRRPRAALVAATALALALLAAPGVWNALRTPTGGVELADEPPAEEPGTETSDDPEEEGTAGDGDPGDGDPGEGDPDGEGQTGGGDDPGVEPLGGFGSDPVSGELPPGTAPAYLTDVRVGGHDGFDRVVLEFENGGTSEFQVAYEDPPIRSAGEGAEVAIDGEAFLVLRLLSASGVAFGRGAADGYEETYTGPARVTGDTSVVTEAVRTGDFEATLSWAVGLDRRVPFSVTVLTDPLRLVVDLRSAP